MTDRPGRPPVLSAGAAAVLTFLAAGCVLVLEIAAGRLLAPYVGVSLTTYTGIIGVILAGIATGAWLGGRLADLHPAARLVGPTLALGGLAAMASVPVVGIVGGLRLGAGVEAIVFLAFAGFVAPAAILSAVAPMIVRATLTDLSTSGTLVGRLSAIGTVGAISGTFLTGFVLLGLVPTRTLIVATGALLVVVGAVAAWWYARAAPAAPLVVLAATLLGGAGVLAPGPCQRESAYYCIAVEPDPGNPGGRTLVLDRLRHAYVDLDDPRHLEFGYVRRFADAAAPVLAATDGRADVLHIGGGGFSFPRYLLATAPGSRHTVLELDPVVLATAQRELGLETADALRVVTGDARLSIATRATDAFDLVVGDAFGGLSVPWHLTTAEFLEEVDRVMRPSGRYLMNLIDGPGLRFVRAETATLATRFEHVAVVTSAAAFAGEAGGNVVLVASHEPLDVADLARRIAASADGAITRVLTAPADLDAFTAGAPVLTDDFAPVDQLIAQ